MKKHIINSIGMLLMIAALGFIIKKFIELGIDFSLFSSPSSLLMIVWLSIIQLIALSILAYAWRLILSYCVKTLPSICKTNSVYYKSNIAKYLPGNVGQFVGRQIFGISLGMTQAQLALSSFLEVGFTVFGALIVALLFGGRKITEASLHPSAVYMLFIVGIVILLALIALLLVFRRKQTSIMVWELVKERKFWFRATTILFLYIVQFFIFGVVFVFLVQQDMHISTIDDIWFIIAVTSISWLVGFITPGVPGGIGVRESALLLMLSNYPQEVILTAAIMQRVIMIIGDVVSWGIGFYFGWRERGDNELR